MAKSHIGPLAIRGRVQERGAGGPTPPFLHSQSCPSWQDPACSCQLALASPSDTRTCTCAPPLLVDASYLTSSYGREKAPDTVDHGTGPAFLEPPVFVRLVPILCTPRHP